jgi:hypothetical protein
MRALQFCTSFVACALPAFPQTTSQILGRIIDSS